MFCFCCTAYAFIDYEDHRDAEVSTLDDLFWIFMIIEILGSYKYNALVIISGSQTIEH